MMTFPKQMQIFPALSKDFVGKGMKRFIFWTVLVLHCSVFVIPFCWYLLMTWLNPPQKAISVTLVENPTPEPAGKRGMPANSKKSAEAKTTREVAAPPEIGDVPNLPDIPDLAVPEVPRITPRRPPKPKDPPVKTRTPPVKTTPVAVPSPPVKHPPATAKTEAVPVKKKTMEERIREWRKQHGKTVRVTTKNTNPAAGTGTSARTKELAGLANDINSMIGNGGTGDSGAGGVYDPYPATLVNYIQARWQPYKPDSIALRGTKPMIPLFFEIDGSGRILRKSIQKRCGIPAVDAAAEALLRGLIALPPPPDRKRQTVIINLEVEPARMP